MLIHSYVTDGFYSFAISLIESFKQKHGEDIPFLLHSKNLSEKQIDALYGRYKALTIRNSEIDWKWLEEKSGMSKSKLEDGKHQVEHLGNRYMSKEFYHWKHYISIYSRYRDAIAEAFEFAGDGNQILHLDVDLFISKPINTIFQLIKSSDVSLLLRPRLTPEWRKMYGCILGFTVNDKSKEFMKRAREYIDKPSFTSIPKGYGQIVFWRAWNDFSKRKDIIFGKIPETWVNKGWGNKGYILSANNGLKKFQTAKRYQKLVKEQR
jgi:hypothetical protein